jgi:KUP system potassium uptake protein
MRDFVRHTRRSRVQRVPGTAVFLNEDPHTTPLALRANVEHNHVRHENVVAMSIETERVPHVAARDRLQAEHFGDAHDGIVHLTARFGFQDHPNVPAALRLAVKHGLLEEELDPDATSYFVSRTALVRTRAPGMSGWRKSLYVAIAHNAAGSVEHFRLPHDRTVIMGEQIAL